MVAIRGVTSGLFVIWSDRSVTVAVVTERRADITNSDHDDVSVPLFDFGRVDDGFVDSIFVVEELVSVRIEVVEVRPFFERARQLRVRRIYDERGLVDFREEGSAHFANKTRGIC